MDRLIVTLSVSELKSLIGEVVDAKIRQQPNTPAAVAEMELPQFLSRQQVAELFNVSLVTIDKWKKHRILPKPIKQAGRIYFLRRDIEKMIEEKVARNQSNPL